MAINNVVLVGNLTKDVDLRYTPSGHAVARCTIAVTRDFKGSNGEYESDFIQLQVWRKTAEFLANHAVKGSKVAVTGRIETGSYEKDGQRVFTTEVVVNSVQLLDKKQQREQQQSYQAPAQQQAPAREISMDDLPF